MPVQTSDLLSQAEKIVNDRIRPYLHSHGGDIVIDEIRNGVLYFTLTGGCSGCSASWLTVEDLIRPAILEEIPELTDVSVSQQMDAETLQMIKDVLAGREIFSKTPD